MQKQRETKDLSSTSRQQVTAKHFQGSRTWVRVAGAPGDKHLNNKTHLLLSLPPFSQLLFLTRYHIEYLFAQLGSAVLFPSPPEILTTPALLVREECWRDSLGAVPALLSSHWALVHYQHLFSWKHSTEEYHGESSFHPIHLSSFNNFWWTLDICFRLSMRIYNLNTVK